MMKMTISRFSNDAGHGPIDKHSGGSQWAACVITGGWGYSSNVDFFPDTLTLPI